MSRKFLPGRVFGLGLFFLIAQVAWAENTPPLCLEAQQCLDGGLPPVLGSCLLSDPTCPTTSRQMVITAQEVANNAMSIKECDTRTFRRASHCLRCFRRAKEIVRELKRRDQGVLGNLPNQALSLLDLQGKARCAHLSGTERVFVSGNLDFNTALIAVPGGVPSFTDLLESAEFVSYVEVFDRSGNSHTISVFFFHVDEHIWDVRFYVDGSEVGGIAGEPEEVGNVTLTFDPTGARELPVPATDASITPSWAGARSKSIAFSFIPLTSLSATSAINISTQ